VLVVGGETNDNGKSGVLATATYIDFTDNNRKYFGTMVSFQKEDGGTVFNAATINWVTGLSQQEGLWNSADQITWNVFNRLSGGPTAGLIAVPDIFEMSATVAANLIEAAGLVPKFTGVNQTHSWVSSQAPTARQLVTRGSTVTMFLRAGPLP